MRSKWVAGVVLAVFFTSVAAPVSAAQGDKIVRTRALNGLPVITAACQLLGCTVLLSLDTPPDQPAQPSSLFLVRGLVDSVLTLALSLLGLASIEPDLPVGVTQSTGVTQASAAVLDQLWDRTPMTYYGTVAWEGYLRQPANDIVRLRDTHCGLGETGAGIVAVIDTGVDLAHPTLKPVLVGGYDFTHNQAGGGESAAVGQASAAVLDGIYQVNSSTYAVVNQASAAVLDDPSNAAFGHGTMTAGVVHLAAPSAKILSLKAFGSDGRGYTSDIIRAIYYATWRGAKVLSMSFSRPTSSPELKIALTVATTKGLIAVASAGNDGSSAPTYPAAYDNVMGVASTSNDDVRSSFSNYGPQNVFVGAPGEGIITTYPGATFAAAWGTSFAAPYVSGEAALLAGMRSTASNSVAASLIAHAKRLTPDLNNGRVDFYQAVLAGRALWPYAPRYPVPDTCSSSGNDWSAVQ